MKIYYLYILGSATGTIYIGVTNDLDRRLAEHRDGAGKGFAKRYGCDKLVYVERHHSITDAIAREDELKGWRRAKKVRLIESDNPQWRDLSAE